MNSKLTFLLWPFVMIIITLGIFFITKELSCNLALAASAAFIAAFASIFVAPYTSAAFIAAFAAFAAALAVLFVILVILVAPSFATFIALLVVFSAFITVSTALEYAEKHGLTKKYVLLWVAAESMFIFAVMLWHIIAHQEQIRVVTLRFVTDVFL